MRDPYDTLVPYSKYHVVERPAGLTEAERRAEVGPIWSAGPVVTAGALRVVRVRSAPVTVPASLVATMRKW